LPENWQAIADLRLTADSPAVRSGIPLSSAWPDPLRNNSLDAPDIGALPLGVMPWRIGVHGRISVFGGQKAMDRSQPSPRESKGM
jgi:hypothetical protein